jgi:Transposase IS4
MFTYTNNQLRKKKYKDTTRSEILKFVGLLILCTKYKWNQQSDLWATIPPSKYKMAPQLRKTECPESVLMKAGAVCDGAHSQMRNRRVLHPRRADGCLLMGSSATSTNIDKQTSFHPMVYVSTSLSLDGTDREVIGSTMASRSTYR